MPNLCVVGKKLSKCELAPLKVGARQTVVTNLFFPETVLHLEKTTFHFFSSSKENIILECHLFK